MRFLFFLIFLFINMSISAQLLQSKHSFTKADTLRGALRPERTAFDMLKYDLNIAIDTLEKSITGYNKITFKVLQSQQILQLDLFENMLIDSIIFNDKKLKHEREFNAVFIDFENELKKEKEHDIQVFYHGKPIIAKRAPWDGGFVFSKDKNNTAWIAVAVQGTGASLWFPNKDHLSDEPDQTDITLSVPENLVAVSNGRLIEETPNLDGTKSFKWRVTYPINNYNITVNIGDYVHFQDKYEDLDLDYYVLSYNLEKAKTHFEQVKPMMACFYEKIGSYPFEKDSFKLVETPYLGMEHQSAVAYGNNYMMGYRGGDLSGTGYGLKFDYLIIHEAAHEWFGNNISVKDIADLWIHEGFTTYAESIYVECEFGKDAALDYMYGQRRAIRNDRPLIGKYDVNHEGSSDMYFKGSNIINTLRTLVDNDELWWNTLKSFNRDFAYQTTTTEEVINFFNKELDLELDSFFQQYLYEKTIPKLVIEKIEDSKKFRYRWESVVENFDMPINLMIDGKLRTLKPTTSWKKLKLKSGSTIKLDKKSYYIDFELK